MYTFIITFSSFLILTGIVGAIIPSLPSAPISFLGLLIYAIYTKFETIPLYLIIILFILSIGSIIINYYLGIFSAKKFKATKYGIWGGIIGILIGILLSPFGLISILICPPIGAIVGEILSGRKVTESTHSGIGYFIGLILGLFINFSIIAAIIYIFLKALLS